jgi:hypothetical protein
MPTGTDAVPATGEAAGDFGARHRRLLQDANAALAASPAPALLESVHAIHRILLSADPDALRGSVGWFGRLLGRDIVLQAEADALRHEVGVHVMQARRQLEALSGHDRQLQALGLALQAAIDALGEQSGQLAGEIVAGDGDGDGDGGNDRTRRLQHLAMLAASLKISASHLQLTLANHADLVLRVGRMLPRVELLLDQQRMLQAGLTEQGALLAAAESLESLQRLEHVNVATATPEHDTHR